MKTLYISLEQAAQIGSDLVEYADMKDSSDRPLFKGFKFSFGDMLADGVEPDQSLEITPISDFLEISADTSSYPPK